MFDSTLFLLLNDSHVFAYSCLTTDRARSVKGALAATLVAQLHAVVQQFLFLSQARVHVGRKCVGREEVCVRERDRVRVWKKVGRVF